MILAHPEVPTESGKFVPGRHVTDRQMRLSMKLRSRETPAIAVARAGFSAAAAYRFEGDGRAFPSSRKVPWGRRCSGPLAGIWEWEICADDLGSAGIAGDSPCSRRSKGPPRTQDQQISEPGQAVRC